MLDMALQQTPINSSRGTSGTPQEPPHATSYIRISEKLFDSIDKTDISEILKELEFKRQQLDQQVVSFITDVQRSFDQFSENLLKQRLATQHSPLEEAAQPKLNASTTSENGKQRQHAQDVPSRGQLETSRRRPSSSPLQYSRTRTLHDDRSPQDDREMELAGFFTPHFLPLLEASRSNSSPEVPTAKQVDEVLEIDPSKLERSTSVPLIEPPPTRKSALRQGRSAKNRRKRVSLSIDDSIVRPSDEPQTDTPVTPSDDDEASVAPNVAITDKDGSTVYVWVPEKARLPLPDEDPIDYVVAVGGVLHEDASEVDLVGADKVNEEEHTKSTAPTAHHFDWSPTMERKEFISVSDKHHSLSPNKSTFLPPPSPSLAIRQAPTYTDSFSTSSHRIHSPTPTPSPKLEEAGGLPPGAEGPPSSYVGGISGSGVDAMDKGSVGYPSSLGASYMEQFAAKRFSGSQNLAGLEQGKDRGLDLGKEKKKKKKVIKDARPEERIADSDEFLGEMEEI